MRSRGVCLGLTVILAALGSPTAALGAETIGQLGEPDPCIEDRAEVASQVAAGASYSPSADGVITSWSTVGDASPSDTLKLLVQRPNPVVGPNHFVITKKDAVRTLLPNQLNTFTGVRLPIEADEQIGVYIPSGQDGGAPCSFPTSFGTGDVIREVLGEPSTGVSFDYTGTFMGHRLNISAVVEPDADHDDFGDETQDQCPTDAALQGPCADTTITRSPKNKTRKAKATFGFSSNVPGATFECKLDKGAFAPCTSPNTERVRKGKHSFQVRAVSPGGVPDPTPASDRWRVKKKKKK